jgi:hypothetical protein
MSEDERFELEGYRSEIEVYTCMTLRNQDDSYYYPVECRIDLLHNAIRPHDAQHLLLDFQDYYFDQYFSNDRDLYLTIDWSDIKFEEFTIQVRGQIFNRKLERIADQLLSGELSYEEANQKIRS